MTFNQRQKILAMVAAAVLGLLLVDQWVLTPLVRTWKARSERINQLRTRVTEGRLLLDRETTLRSRWQGMLTNLLPAEPSRAEAQLLTAVERWAAASQVTITSVRPQWRPQEGNLVTLECRVDAAGSLPALVRLLYELERDPMAVKVDALELTARDDTGSQLALGLQVSGLVSNGVATLSRR
ncbi:MAG: GspMb/PilO family protein [Verrucomicrobiota bacterium]|nr:type II secretion system protein M [Limisphaera sp.]MDW8381190.1 GspMb/PilO family protein [Verrucomicrobiota bacterium]